MSCLHFFLPLALECSPLRLLAHHSRETLLIKVTNDLHLLNPMLHFRPHFSDRPAEFNTLSSTHFPVSVLFYSFSAYFTVPFFLPDPLAFS